MSANSLIEWTEKTWNPVLGCSKCSTGCAHCYAEIMSRRLAAMAKTDPNPGKKLHYRSVINETGGWNGQLTCVEETLDEPLHWRKPSKVFVNSMSDLFHDGVPVEFIKRVFDVMGKAHWHTFQILTKRSARLAELAAQLPWHPNIWMGVSVENDSFRQRIDDLRKVPAAIRFLSLEPLLGPLSSLDLAGIHWVIVGGESGPKARPMKPEWALDLRDQCLKAKVPFFFKQWGGVRKKLTGCELEGQTWKQTPSAHLPPRPLVESRNIIDE